MTATSQTFLAALQNVQATGLSQTVGTFTLSATAWPYANAGFHTSQMIERGDDWGRPGNLTPRDGGLRYWPASSGALKKYAAALAREDAAEMANRTYFAAGPWKLEPKATRGSWTECVE